MNTELQRRCEGRLLVTCNRREGIWAVHTNIWKIRSNRTAGRLPREASAHTLLSVAIVAGLSNITARDVTSMKAHATEPITRPRVLIQVRDESFADALKSLIAKKPGDPARIGRNFLLPLAKQLARFAFTLQTEMTGGEINSLHFWAVKTVFDPRDIEIVPPAFQPVAIQERV